MPNEVQDAILKAIDNLTKDRMNRLQTDKTITGTVVQCTNSLTGEHQINYQGGNLVAYSEDGTSYNKNADVYVLVPEGNFSNKKIILGKATAIEDDLNITFVSSLVEDYNTIGRNVISKKNNNYFALHSYLKEDYLLIYNYDYAISADSKIQDRNLVDIDIEEFRNYLLEAEALMVEASFQTRLPREHRNAGNGIYGLQLVLAFNNDNLDDEYVYKNYSYVLDTNSMTGNPFAYTSWSDQYGIFPIDVENFSHVQYILFYSYGFESEDNIEEDIRWGADIWCDQLELYGLQHIDESNGDYKLKISAPQGQVFKTADSQLPLEIVATVKHQATYLTDSTMFYWFKQDARVTASSEDYSMYGGTGWKRLKDKGNGAEIKVYEKDNKAYENKYLCVAVYKEEIILKYYFTIYNEAMRRTIGIVSDLGVKFSFDRGTPTLTCEIDGRFENFEEDEATHRPDEYYSFMWSKIDSYGQVYNFNQTVEQLKQEYDEAIANANIVGYSTISYIQSQIDLMNGIIFKERDGIDNDPTNTNIIQVPVSGIDNFATYRCSVYLKESVNSESYFIGSADITLQNENAANPNDYFIVITNGDQVFQYSETGVTPTSERWDNPQIIYPLEAKFYDPAGLEVNEGTYQVHWVVPYENTMIQVPSNDLHINPANGHIELFMEDIYPMDIKDNFDYQALNNQVTCVVEYQNQTYMKETNFSFIKIGDNGTNGTDVSARILPLKATTDKILDTDMLTMIIDTNNNLGWNTGQSISEKVLGFNLYQREQKLALPETKLVSWSLSSGSNSNNFIDKPVGDINGASINLNEDYFDSSKRNKLKNNQIVKAQTYLDGDNINSTTYYAYYPIPIIKYNSDLYELHIDCDYTLQQILYNADGHNPLYNKNQGIKLRFVNNENASIVSVMSLDISDDLNSDEAIEQVYEELKDIWSDPDTSTSKKINESQEICEELRSFFDSKNIDAVITVPEKDRSISAQKLIEAFEKAQKELYINVNLIKLLQDHFDKATYQTNSQINAFKEKLNSIWNNPNMTLPAKRELIQELFQEVEKYVKENEAELSLNDREAINDFLDEVESLTDIEPEVYRYDNKVIVLEVLGGEDNSSATAAFQLMTEKNAADSKASLNNPEIVNHSFSSLGVDRKNELMMYVLPDDVYSGMYTNNVVHGKVYRDSNFNNSTIPDCEFWIPVHMQLNTYGLASLNAWDGNHIEINEDADNGGYILAPQIGAGKKEKGQYGGNVFTGIVMGQVETYDKGTDSVGLLGYSKGKQSIWLDSETGNATFGLAEGLYESNNPQAEGRIELRPGGVSSISKWHFDNTSLYSANLDGVDLRLKKPTEEEKADGYIYVEDSAYSDAPTADIIENGKIQTVKTNHSIPHWAQGVMLESNPAYISVKGKRILDSKNIDFDAANTVIVQGDAFEVQLDPNDTSIFTVYRHTNTINDTSFRVMYKSNGDLYIGNTKDSLIYAEAQYSSVADHTYDTITGWKLLRNIKGTQVAGTFILPEKSGESSWALRAIEGNYTNQVISKPLAPSEGVWRREAKVGINAQGRFYTNALKDSSTALNIGSIGAFGVTANYDEYLGAAFEVGDNSKTLIKFFTSAEEANKENGHLYLSGSTAATNDYQRPISLHGNDICLYAAYNTPKSNEQTHKVTNNAIELTSGLNGHILLQKNVNSFELADSGKLSSLNLTGSYQENISLTKTSTVQQSVTETYGTTTSHTYQQTVSGAVTKTWNKAATLTIGDNLTLTTGTTDSGLTIKTTNSTGNREFLIGSQKNTTPSFPATTSTTSYNSNSTFRQAMVRAGFLKLNGGTGRSTLVANGGLDIATNTGSLVLASWGNATGVDILASPTTGSPSSGVRLKLTPQDGGGGDFSLSAPHGTVASNTNIGSLPNPSGSNTTYQGVNVTPGVRSYFLNITNSSTTNGHPKYGVTSSRPIQINGTGQSIFNHAIYGNSFYFNSSQTGTYNVNGSNQTHANQSVWNHLSTLYSLFGSLRNDIRTWVTNNYATKNELSTGLAGKANANHTHNYAPANHSHDDYVAKTTYNNHGHRFILDNNTHTTQAPFQISQHE